MLTCLFEYVRGLHPATRKGVSQQVRMLPGTRSQDLSVVQQIALSIGKGYRALSQFSRSPAAEDSQSKARRTKSAMFVGGYETHTPPSPFQPSTPSMGTQQ